MWGNVGKGAAILVAVFVAPLLLIPVLVIAHSHLWGTEAERRRDRRDFPQAHALETHLEQTFAEYPAMGNPTFELADIFPTRVTRACLATGIASINDATFVLARRAPRPMWWGGTQYTATVPSSTSTGRSAPSTSAITARCYSAAAAISGSLASKAVTT